MAISDEGKLGLAVGPAAAMSAAPERELEPAPHSASGNDKTGAIEIMLPVSGPLTNREDQLPADHELSIIESHSTRPMGLGCSTPPSARQRWMISWRNPIFCGSGRCALSRGLAGKPPRRRFFCISRGRNIGSTATFSVSHKPLTGRGNSPATPRRCAAGGVSPKAFPSWRHKTGGLVMIKLRNLVYTRRRCLRNRRSN